MSIVRSHYDGSAVDPYRRRAPARDAHDYADRGQLARQRDRLVLALSEGIPKFCGPMSTRDIAGLFRVTPRAVQKGISRARGVCDAIRSIRDES